MNQLFLSCLKLNPHRSEVRRDLADCHQMHRTLMSAFPHLRSGSARDEFALLYRVETNARTGQVTVIAQSGVEPIWGKLPSRYLLDAPSSAACKLVDDLYAALGTGRCLQFRLRANPTKRVSERNQTQDPRWRGKRIELRGEEEQIAWLHRKATQHGFRALGVRLVPEVANVRVTPESKIIGWRENGELAERRRLTFGAALFEGLLEIENVETFRQALACGIGSGKAYGFGLLSIAPAGQ